MPDAEALQRAVRTLADGSYPHAKTMSMIVHRNPAAATAKFLAFVASGEGRRILVETGHVPPASNR